MRTDIDRNPKNLKDVLNNSNLRAEFLGGAKDTKKAVKAFVQENAGNALKTRPKVCPSTLALHQSTDHTILQSCCVMLLRLASVYSCIEEVGGEWERWCPASTVEELAHTHKSNQRNKPCVRPMEQLRSHDSSCFSRSDPTKLILRVAVILGLQR